MAQRGKTEKGYRLEELLRSYFLRAGFFAVRGIPFQHGGEDLTDIDVWLYERPTGSSRRRQIVDAKSRTKPKAVERMLWTKGLVQLLDVDGAYVATTDARPMLRGISKKLGILVLDGADIKRISESEKVRNPDRMSEEDFALCINTIDKARRNKELHQQYHDIKFSLIDNFGVGTINRALDSFMFLSSVAVTAQPNTDAAKVALRLSYFAGAVTALSLDYIGSEISFRAAEERRLALVNAIRFGNIEEADGLERVRLALGLVQKYAPNGNATAQSIDSAVRKDLRDIPAETIAEHVVKNLKPEDLFQIAKRLEHHCFSWKVAPFDALDVEDKGFIGVLLDYCSTDRVRFASSWSASVRSQGNNGKQVRGHPSSGPLFSDIEQRRTVKES